MAPRRERRRPLCRWKLFLPPLWGRQPSHRNGSAARSPGSPASRLPMPWQVRAPKREHCGVVLVRRQQNARGGGAVPASTPKRVLKIQKLDPITQGRIFIRSREVVADPASPGVKLVPVLHSIRTAVSASRESRLRESLLHGETRRRTAFPRIRCSISCWRTKLPSWRRRHCGTGGPSYPHGGAGTVGRVQRFKDAIA